jgi:serine/threonine-protein kinase
VTEDFPVLKPGDLLGNKLQIVRRLSAGGMGVVYEAVQVHLSRRVAVKVIRADEAGAPDARARFMIEARAQARLPLEHIVHVLDVDTLPDGTLYTVMEYLDGHDLKRELRKRGPLPFDEAASYLVQACRGAAAAHASGIVHRDIKPQNLFITNLDGARKIKLLDFGIAKFTQGLQHDLTTSGEVMGTPTYLSPEQIAGSDVDGRTDVWSLGIVLYELLSQTTPFRRDSALATLGAIAHDKPTPLRQLRSDVPSGLESIIERCLTKARDQRYDSADQLERALAEYAETFNGQVRPSLRASRGSSLPAGPPSDELLAQPLVVPAAALGLHDKNADTALEIAKPAPAPLPALRLPASVRPPPSKAPWVVVFALGALVAALGLLRTRDTAAPRPTTLPSANALPSIAAHPPESVTTASPPPPQETNHTTREAGRAKTPPPRAASARARPAESSTPPSPPATTDTVPLHL